MEDQGIMHTPGNEIELVTFEARSVSSNSVLVTGLTKLKGFFQTLLIEYYGLTKALKISR